VLKRMSVYSLPEGTDPDEFWKYHKEAHAPDIKKGYGPRLKRYVPHRVTKVIDGEPSFYRFVELWCDSEEDFEEGFKAHSALKTPEEKAPHQDFLSWVTNFFMVHADEEVIVP